MIIPVDLAFDPVVQEMITFIHQFPRSSLFFKWLVDEQDLKVHMILEKIEENTYERVAEYHLKDRRIYGGGGQFKLSEIPESFRKKLMQNKGQVFSLISELVKIEKRDISRTINGGNYTVIAEWFYKEKLCGSAWEVYDLHNLLAAYKKRKASLKENS